MQSEHLTAFVLLVAVACLALGMWLATRIRQLRETLRGRAANARGKRGERAAERLLEALGYRICERQARACYELEVDGERLTIDLALDLIVERHGERLVVEVKTGGSAPRLTRPETRRQLLEYQLATGSSRVLLVDPEAGTLTEVAFPLPTSAAAGSASDSASGRASMALATLTALLAALAWWWSKGL